MYRIGFMLFGYWRTELVDGWQAFETMCWLRYNFPLAEFYVNGKPAPFQY